MLNVENNIMNACGIKKESSPMRFFRRIGLDSIAWSLRRLYCPVPKDALVLEIGSGDNPYVRANVLCDAYLDTAERHFEKLVVDRPMVLAHAELLPFKDDSFDFVIASHILEHSSDPQQFIAEMERVGRAGYIEVPDAFMERLTNYPFHYLEITDLNGGLFIRKKNGPIQDIELFELFKNKARGVARRWFEINPFNFHVRYYWGRESGGVRYTIVNPEYKFDWEFTQIPSTTAQQRMSVKTMFNKVALFLFRALFSQNRRNREIKLEKYLKCLKCGGDVIARQSEYTCVKCGRSYSIIRGQIPDFRR